MATFIASTLLFVTALVLAFALFAAFAHRWIRHKVRLSILERLQEDPSLLAPDQEPSALLDAISHDARGSHDFLLTGVFTTVLGLLAMAAGRLMVMGTLAAGLYFGGICSAVAGVILALLGWCLRHMDRTARRAHRT